MPDINDSDVTVTTDTLQNSQGDVSGESQGYAPLLDTKETDVLKLSRFDYAPDPNNPGNPKPNYVSVAPATSQIQAAGRSLTNQESNDLGLMEFLVDV